MTEFSRIFDLSLSSVFIGPQSITASLDECAALAKRFKIISITSLTADFRLFHDSEDQCFRLSGTFESTLTQASIISLEPVEEILRCPLHIKIRLKETHKDDDLLLEDEDDDEDVEYSTTTKVDVGELVAQYLSLTMNPYPKTVHEQQQALS